MLSGITNMLKKVLGDKAKRDVKEIEPIVAQIKKEYETLQNLSNDALREETIRFKREIADYLREDELKIEEINKQIDTNHSLSIEEKESLYDEIDRLKEDLDIRIEEILNKVLPRAFAVMKETARRFTENEEIVVTATDFDRELSIRKGHIRIEGDKAIWKNTWTAAGGEIQWNIIHYDVQLIGGIALHQGKISEMQTG